MCDIDMQCFISSSRRDEINAKVLEKRKQKFGVDEEFTGPSDPADAPTSFSGTMEEVFGNYSNEEQPLYVSG